MLVSTLAEEVHTQFTLGERAALARTLVVSMPGLLLTWGAVLGVISYLERTLPPLMPPSRLHRPMPLGSPLLRFISVVGMMLVVVVPFVSLVWKLGLTGQPRAWNSAVAVHFLHVESAVEGKVLLATITMSLVTGLATAGLR